MDPSAVIETLFICRQVNVFRIPPRPPGGHKSGTWLVEDKIFTGRLRVISQGEACTVILEEDSGKEFAQCPIPQGEKDQAVESVTDSSRYFAIRLMSPGDARQKAFVGLGFDDRADAFDFQVALTDHEKHLRRAKDAALAAQSTSTANSNASMSSEAANLYQSRDLSLKQGETMRINFRRPSDGQQSSGLRLGQNTGLSRPPAILPITPPAQPNRSTHPGQASTAVAPEQSTRQLQQTQEQTDASYLKDLLGIENAPPKSEPTTDTEGWTAF